jgi:hypothetical protein
MLVTLSLLTHSVTRNVKPRLPSVCHYAPPAPLDEEQFGRMLRNFLEPQYIPPLEENVISNLFRIVSEAISDLSFKKQQQATTARQDLKSRGQLIEKLNRHVEESLKLLGTYRRRKLPLTRRLIRPVYKEFLQLRKLLAGADVQYRADTVIVKSLQRTFPTDLSLAIDKYLKAGLRELRSQDEQNIVIAGCLLAGGFCSGKQPDQLIRSIPMQLFRARTRLSRVDRVDFRRRKKKPSESPARQ